MRRVGQWFVSDLSVHVHKLLPKVFKLGQRDLSSGVFVKHHKLNHVLLLATPVILHVIVHK